MSWFRRRKSTPSSPPIPVPRLPMHVIARQDEVVFEPDGAALEYYGPIPPTGATAIDSATHMMFFDLPLGLAYETDRAVLVVRKNGAEFRTEIVLAPDVNATLPPGPKNIQSFPVSAPSRMDVLRSRVPFQGFFAETQQFGRIRAWGPELGSLSDDDAKSYVEQAMSITDRSGQRFDGVEFAVSWNYRNYPVPGSDLSNNLQELRRRVKNAIVVGAPLGLKGVKIFCAGDGEGSGPGYNDPQGWTYGVTWLSKNFDRIAAAFGPQPDDPTEMRDWIVFLPSYDGIDAYQVDPDRVVGIWKTMRRVIDAAGHGYVGFEWPAGQIGLGDGYPTYTPENGGCIDVWLLETPACAYPPTDPEDIKKITQQVGRAIRPYQRPAWAVDDPNPPLYVPRTCARGETVVQLYEFGTYNFVNQNVDLDFIEQQRAVLRAMCPGAVVC